MLLGLFALLAGKLAFGSIWAELLKDRETEEALLAPSRAFVPVSTPATVGRRPTRRVKTVERTE